MNLSTLREYIKIHKISLEQDLAYVAQHEDNSDIMCSYLEGSIDVCTDLLEYIDER